MNVKVITRGVAPLYKLFGKKNEILISFSGNTIKDLVEKLTKTYGNGIKKALLDDKDEIDMELRVVINQKEYLMYGERMDKPLKDGDTVYFMGVG